MIESVLPFVSYAPNFVDVMLWRALRHIENGFYIDLGAFDPTELSVTKAFYDRGWRGINVEPLPDRCEKLASARPRDITVQAAIADRAGFATLYEPPLCSARSTLRPGTFDNPNETQPLRTISVHTTTLTDICRELSDRDVHFLRISVEGYERPALAGMDFRATRPWILVIQATLPGTRTPNHHEWEDILERHQYTFVYFDGVNRFYVAAEHQELQPAFAAPPNVFDTFLTPEADRLQQTVDKLQAEVDLLSSERLAHLRDISALTNRVTEIDDDRMQLVETIRRLEAEQKRHLAALGAAEREHAAMRERNDRLARAILRLHADASRGAAR